MSYNSTDRYGTFQSSGTSYSYLTPSTSRTPNIYFSSFYLGTYMSLYTQEFQTRNGKMKFVKDDDYNYILELYDSNGTKVYSQNWTYNDNAKKRLYIAFGLDTSYHYGSVIMFAERNDSSYALLTRSVTSDRSIIYAWINDNLDTTKDFVTVTAVCNIVGCTNYTTSALNNSINLPTTIRNGMPSRDYYGVHGITSFSANKNMTYFLKKGAISINYGSQEYTSIVSIIDEDGASLYDVSFKSSGYIEKTIVVFAFGIDETNHDGYIFVAFSYYDYGGVYRMPSLFRSEEVYNWLKDNMVDITKWTAVYGIKDSNDNTQVLSRVKDDYIYVGGEVSISYNDWDTEDHNYVKELASERLTLVYNKLNS